VAPEYSYAVQYAIDHGIAFRYDGSSASIFSSAVIDMASSYYICDSDFVQTNGYLTFKLNIAIKEEYKNRLSHAKVAIKIPSNASLQPQSLYLNYQQLADDEYSIDDANNKIIIPVSGASTTVSFNLIPTSAGIITTYAQYEYNLGGNTKSNIIGIVNELIPILTISAPPEVSTNTISVSGTTFSNTEVSIYLNDVFVKTLTARKTGKYSGDITINNPQDGALYTVKAVARVNGSDVDAECIVEYNTAATELTEFKMYLEGTTYDLLALKGKSPTVALTSTESPWLFTIRFNNGQSLKNVAVCSTKSGMKKYLDAVWDAAKQQYVASGFFDENNHQYLPGTLTVEYTKQTKEPSLENETPDFSDASKISEAVKELVRDPNRFKVEETTNNGTTYAAHLVIADDETGITHNITYTQSPIPAEYTKANIISKGFTQVTDSSGRVVYTRPTVVSSVVPGVSGADAYMSGNQIISRAESQTIDFAAGVFVDIAADFIDSVAGLPIAGAPATIWNLGNMVTEDSQEYDRWNRNLDTYVQTVRNSGLSESEKQGRYGLVNTARALKTASMYGKCVGVTIAAAAAFGLIGGPAALLVGVGVAAASYLFGTFSEGILMALGLLERVTSGVDTQFRWNIDPSGYVYEAVTSNRLPGARATVWWYAPDEGIDAAREWDASEYDQDNPLYTDNQGRYAWNVPEGMWQVRFEKDGYQNVQTEWLPVPPPQLDVNISMVSLEAPAIAAFNVYDTFAEVEFTKYMDPQTVGNLVLKDELGNAITYTLEYPTNETAADETVYAKYYRLVFGGTIEGNVTLTVPSAVQSYAGVSFVEETLDSSVASQLSLEVPESVTVDMNKSETINIKINGYDGSESIKVVATSESDDIVAVTEVGAVEEDGTVALRLTGNLPGSSAVRVSVEGKGLSVKIPVTVEMGDLIASYTISLDANGGSVGSASLSVTYNTAVGTLPAPVREGYSFDGWFTAVSGGTEYDEGTVYQVNNDLTLYAHWTANSYTVTFSANGGTVIPASVIQTYGSEIGTLPVPTRTGHTFSGWYTATSGGSKIAATTKVVADITYYARWATNSYTVTFDPTGGLVSPASAKKAFGSAIGTLPTPTRAGYTFSGWYTAATGGVKIAATAVVIGNVTYYAQWRINSYKVTFNANGGAVTPASVTQPYNAAIGTLPVPMRTGYTFAGWYTATSGGTKIAATTKVTANITYYAQWKVNSYKVTFNPNGGTVSPTSLTQTYSTAIGTLPVPTRTGYTFAGWYTATSGGTKIATTTKVTANITYYAQWKVNSYTATFNPNGGLVSSASVKKAFGSEIGTLPVPTRAGYTFQGWFTAKSGGTKISAKTKVTANITYYAQWKINSYKVTFSANGGSVSPASITQTYNAAIGSLPTPTRTGYTFQGWFTAKSGGTKISTKTKVTANITYYAQWKINSYKVTFSANGGTVTPTSITQVYNTAVGSLPKPTRSGYTFTGWYTAKSGGTKISTKTKVTADITYYAQWKANSYKVTFNPNGGSVKPTSIAQTYNTAIGSLPTPTRTGYTFQGWFTAKSGGTKISAKTKVSANITYYAQWKAKSYKVTFNPNGGSVKPTSIAQTYNTAIGSLPAPTRSGYTFTGWYTAKSGGTKISTKTKVTADITYYAQWKKK
jgi:uncharacterized repeat protein (TIGR02543 family)